MKLKIWFLIQKRNAIWCMDATGNILQPINGHKSSLLYSIVIYDPMNHIIIPLFEFITSDQSVRQISSFLFLVKEYCLKYKSMSLKTIRFAYAQIITTDFSYILINSILKIFNNCDMDDYLQATFTILIKNSTSLLVINVIIYLCSTHFLKSFINKVIVIFFYWTLERTGAGRACHGRGTKTLSLR